MIGKTRVGNPKTKSAKGVNNKTPAAKNKKGPKDNEYDK